MIWVLRGGGHRYAGLERGLAAEGRTVSIDDEVDPNSMRDVRRAAQAAAPEAIVYAAAWDDPVGCESNADRAFARNAEGVINAVAAAMELAVPVVLLSSAEVFGQRGGPWSEADVPAPGSNHGASRRRGETFLLRSPADALIVRTGFVIEDGLDVEAQGGLRTTEHTYTSAIGAYDLGRVLHALLARAIRGAVHVAAPGEAPLEPQLLRALASARGAAEADLVAPRADEIERPRAPRLFTDRLQKITFDPPLLGWREAIDAAAIAAPLAKAGSAYSIAGASSPEAADAEAKSSPPEAAPAPSLEATASAGSEASVVPPAPIVILASTERYSARMYAVEAGARWPLLTHPDRDVTLAVLTGKVALEVGPRVGERRDLVLKSGPGARILPGEVYRLVALEDSRMLEVGDGILEAEALEP